MASSSLKAATVVAVLLLLVANMGLQPGEAADNCVSDCNKDCSACSDVDCANSFCGRTRANCESKCNILFDLATCVANCDTDDSCIRMCPCFVSCGTLLQKCLEVDCVGKDQQCIDICHEERVSCDEKC